MPASIASASRQGGTQSVSMPRSCARNGHSAEVNSASVESTREPSGRAAATSPTIVDAFAPIATHPTGTEHIRANERRATSVESPQCSQLVRPARQSPSAACRASQAGRGGSP